MSASDHKHTTLSYEDPDYPVSVTYYNLDNTKRDYTRWEWHEDIKVIIVNNGTVQINSDDSSLRLYPGQALLVGRNTMHSIQAIENEACAFYSITFHPDFILGSKGTRLHDKYLHVIDNTGMRFLTIDESTDWHSQLLELLNSVIVANVIRSSGYELNTRSYLCLFWGILTEHIHDYPKDGAPVISLSLDEQRVKDAMSFIREHHAQKLTLDDIADHVKISKSECCRCFKRSISMTPFEYLVKYRVYEAAKILKDPVLGTGSIADISIRVGFNNFSYFSKQFAKYMGCTPREYRKNSKDYSPSTDLMSFL